MPEKTNDKVSLEELMVSTLAMADAAVKVLIQKGVFTDGEFKAQLGAEWANYLARPDEINPGGRKP
jgi:hypothetical protein